MSRWLTALTVAAGVIVVKSIVMLVTGYRFFVPSTDQCMAMDFQMYWSAYVVVFYTVSALVCVMFWPVVYDAMGRPAYKRRWEELNIARWMLILAAALEGFLAWCWGSMPCYVAAIPHTGAVRATALAEMLVAGIVFYATFVARRDARKALGL